MSRSLSKREARHVERLTQDFRYAVRMFRNAPGFTALVVLMLTLGIAANTAVFTIVDAVLLEPLPYRSSDRLVAIWDREIYAQGTSKLFDLFEDYENWKQNAKAFEAVAAVSWAPQASPTKTLKGVGRTRNVFALPVTADFFSLLGVPATVGRTFIPSDEASGCAVVLTHSFWQSAFGGRRSAVSRAIRLDNQDCTVLGVMPQGFGFLPPQAPVAMWTIMTRPAHPHEFGVGIFGRLRRGVSIRSAQAEILSLHRHLHEHDRWGAQVEPVLYNLHDEFTWLTGRNLKLTLVVLFAAVTFVLLVCCINVANLLLGRAIHRERELAIRTALGSGRARLLRQLLTENLLLSVSASIAGVVLAAAALHYFRMTHPIEMPPATSLDWNAPVLIFTVLLSVATTIVFGLAPALKASRTDVNEALKAGSRTSSGGAGHQQLGKLLVAAEMSLTVVLLAGAGLLIQAANRFTSAPLGFNPAGLFFTSIQLPEANYRTPERRLQMYERVQGELARIPGVRGIAFTSSRPIDGGGSQDVIEVEGRPKPRVEDRIDTFSHTISADYFGVTGTRLARGRFFGPEDTARTEKIAIVNQALAQKYFGKEDPVGKHIRPFREGKDGEPWLRIVGVVENQKRTIVYQEMAWVEQPVLYRPVSQNARPSLNIILRAASGDHTALGSSIQQTIAALDPDLPIEEVQPVTDLEAQVAAYPQFRARFLGMFAALALILAVVGLFGVLSRLVVQRTHEIGVRMALGAERRRVLLMILREGAVLTISGIAVGIAGAWVLGHYLSALLYGVRSTDASLLIALAALLLASALIAMYIPAYRAAKVDPIVALRHD